MADEQTKAYEKKKQKAIPWQKENPDTKMAKPSPNKAKEILRDGTAHGKKLTDKQKRFMGWAAGGGKPRSAGEKKAGKKMGNK